MNRRGAKLKLAANRKPLKERPIPLDRSTWNLSVWGPTAVWAAVLFLLSAVPLTGEVSWFPVNDKVIHVGLYGVLGITLARARVHSGVTWPHVAFVMLGALYGITDEWHQAFVPGRSVSLLDWIADVTGVLLGYTVFLIMISNRAAEDSHPARPGPRNEGI